MIQDITPKKLYNEYITQELTRDDYIAIFEDNKILIKETETGLAFPKQPDLADFTIPSAAMEQAHYLFRIDQDQYFLFTDNGKAISPDCVPSESEPSTTGCSSSTSNLHWMKLSEIRTQATQELCFAAYTAYHLAQWYRNNRFCGHCSAPTLPDQTERMLYCPQCGNRIYPKIAPAVIVAVTNGDQILLTRYANREYKRYALIAGFTEIGETAEDTVRREVMEEAGIRVKNIRYYKSQPWGIDSNLLLGYFAQLDGSDQITIDKKELASAMWVGREELKDMDDSFSLTREMMRVFYELGNQ